MKTSERDFRPSVILGCFILVFSLSLFVLFSSYAFGKVYSVPLLSVSEENGRLKGNVAEAYLEIKPGAGRIFIDCFPFNKMDLQVSVRYARDLACKLAHADCSKLDFFYVIRADASIIGGPSAGSSLAFLTFAALKGMSYDKKTVATGTINAGYIIGPVGGLKEKIEAAASKGFKKVLIPAGQGKQIVNLSSDVLSSYFNTTPLLNTTKINASVNASVKTKGAFGSNLTLIEYGRLLGLNVVEVFDLFDVIYEFTGKNFSKPLSKINPVPYSQRMHNISETLCEKAFEINSSLPSPIPVEFQEIYNQSQTNLIWALNESLKGNYYSAASLCFSSLTDLFMIYIYAENFSMDYLLFLTNVTLNRAQNLKQNIKKQYSTLGDLQVSGAIIERLNEAETQLKLTKQLLELYLKNKTHYDNLYENLRGVVLLKAVRGLSYGVNRIFSAELWSNFLGFDKKKVNLNERALKETCMTKLSEVSGLLDYFSLAYPSLLEDARKRLKEARTSKENGDYALCIYQASLAKAYVNNLMTATYLTPPYYNKSVLGKIKVGERLIGEQQDEHAFPIMGYSYLQYAKSLYELGDIYSASLYADYALELSNLDVYFDTHSRFSLIPYSLSPLFKSFSLGMFSGFILASFAFYSFKKRKSKRREKTRAIRRR